MVSISERIVVIAREFVEEKNINDSKDFNEPLFRAKMNEFGWELAFSAASIMCEIVWKMAIGRESISEYRQLDRLFAASPIATHANFRGSNNFKTGNTPEPGALAVYRRGNSWQGTMVIVTEVSEDKQSFDAIDGRVLEGSQDQFIRMEEKKGKRMGLPFRNDKLNLVGFIYPPHREIN